MRKAKFTVMLVIASVVVSPFNSYAALEGDSDYSPSNLEITSEEREQLLNDAIYVASLEEDKDYVQGQVFCEAGSIEEAERMAEDCNARLLSFEEGYAVLDLGRDTSDFMKEEANSQSINLRVHPDYILSEESINDPSYDLQWFHETVKDSEVWDISDGSGAVVAVVDTGIDSSHPDLDGNIYKADKCGKAASAEDSYGHGTHVAGIIAAEKNNEAGGCGVAPGAKLYSICAGNPSSSTEYITLSALLAGVKKAVSENAAVVNLSLGLVTDPDDATKKTMQEVIDYAYEMGTLVVAAAGNGSSSQCHYPAALDHVIAVGACTQFKELAYYSNYGEWVDIVAPGSTIYSTYLDGGYDYSSGTSMATPIISGAAALIYSHDQELLSAHDASSVDYVTEKLLSATDGEKYFYKNESRSVSGGCIDFSKLFDIEENNDDSTNKEDGDSRQDESAEAGNDIPSQQEAVSESDNSVSDIIMSDGTVIRYNSRIEYCGKKIKVSDLGFSMSCNGTNYALKSARIANGKHAGIATIGIRKLETSDKALNKLYKNVSFSVEILPKTVSSTNLTVEKKADGSLRKVAVNMNGKNKTVKKNMYSYDPSSRKISFSGDFKGEIIIE